MFQLKNFVLCEKQSQAGGPCPDEGLPRGLKSIIHSPPSREQAHEKDGAGKSIRVKIASQDVNHTTRIVRN